MPVPVILISVLFLLLGAAFVLVFTPPTAWADRWSKKKDKEPRP